MHALYVECVYMLVAKVYVITIIEKNKARIQGDIAWCKGSSLGKLIKKVKAFVGQLCKKLNFMMELFNEVQEYV